MIDNEYCGVCEQCVPKCPKDLIIKIGYTMKVRDGCDDCGLCIEACPLGILQYHFIKLIIKILPDLLNWIDFNNSN